MLNWAGGRYYPCSRDDRLAIPHVVDDVSSTNTNHPFLIHSPGRGINPHIQIEADFADMGKPYRRIGILPVKI